MRRLGVALGLAVVALTGCRSSGSIVRIVDGVAIDGRYVEPEAYSAFLRGVLAEEDGRVDDALAAYGAAEKADDPDPEIAVRKARVLCKRSPAAAEVEVARALSMDPSYAPAWAARAACKALSGDLVGANEAAAKARALDPHRAEYEWLAPTDGARSDDQLLAATLVYGERSAAWDALASWARAHGNASLYARATQELLARAPSRRVELAERSLELAGRGEVGLARAVALAALMVDGLRLSPVASLLAVDGAILSQSPALLERAGVRAHVAPEEIAARALLLGEVSIARARVAEVLSADPQNASAVAVALALGRPGLSGPVLQSVGSVELGAATWIALARRLLAVSPESGVAWARAASHAAVLAFDGLLVPHAVDLAARGVPVELPPDGRVELAARQGTAAPLDIKAEELGARHRLLQIAIAPAPAVASERDRLMTTMAPAFGRDRVVTTALLRVEPSRAKALDPRAAVASDGLVAGEILVIALSARDDGAVTHARLRACPLAATPREIASCGASPGGR